LLPCADDGDLRCIGSRQVLTAHMRGFAPGVFPTRCSAPFAITGRAEARQIHYTEVVYMRDTREYRVRFGVWQVDY
jgi:hypothetical protein